MKNRMENISISLNLSWADLVLDLKYNQELVPTNFSYRVIGGESDSFNSGRAEVSVIVLSILFEFCKTFSIVILCCQNKGHFEYYGSIKGVDETFARFHLEFGLQ